MSGISMMLLAQVSPTNGIISIGGTQPLVLNPDGTVSSSVLTGSPIWIPGAPIANIGSSYYARTTDFPGSTFVPASGVWRPLVFGVSYTMTGFVGSVTGSIDFSIDGVNIVNTAYFTIKNN